MTLTDTVANETIQEAGKRHDGRNDNQLRPVRITRHFTKYAAGSVLFEIGNTKVLATASVEERTPRHITDPNHGWLTAEYSLLPSSTHTRNNRERQKLSGRTTEIQRLIGRSLRACIDLKRLGDRTITIDADVIQADGGTRTASITAGYIAMVDALRSLQKKGLITELPLNPAIAAISVGILNGQAILDLNYEEDSIADVDANIVMDANGEIIEFQATSENAPMSRQKMMEMLDLGEHGIRELLQLQIHALALGEENTGSETV